MHVLDVKPSASKMMRYYHRAILLLAVLEQIVVSHYVHRAAMITVMLFPMPFSLRPVMIEIPNGGGGNSSGGGGGVAAAAAAGAVSKDAAGSIDGFEVRRLAESMIE